MSPDGTNSLFSSFLLGKLDVLLVGASRGTRILTSLDTGF